MFADGGVEATYVPTEQRGVVFLSSIPSNMRPNEVRLHLQQFGEIFRTKFTAFPKKERSGGRGIMPLMFKNGYVEFLKKGDAINCADLLNGQMVNTKKRRKSHGQLWNIQFMEGFVWGDIAEEREEKTRNRKEMEHRIKETERSANEMFRRMVMMKKQQDDQSNPRRALPARNKPLSGGVADETTAPRMEVPKKKRHSAPEEESSSRPIRVTDPETRVRRPQTQKRERSTSCPAESDEQSEPRVGRVRRTEKSAPMPVQSTKRTVSAKRTRRSD